MRNHFFLLAMAACGLAACGVSSTGADPTSTEAAPESTRADDRTCLVPMSTPVTARSPLWMVGATTIERVDVFWWHGEPQPSNSDPTTMFAIDRHDEDADSIHYSGHELGTDAAARLLSIDVARHRDGSRPLGVATVSTPGQPDERIALRSSVPCAQL